MRTRIALGSCISYDMTVPDPHLWESYNDHMRGMNYQSESIAMDNKHVLPRAAVMVVKQLFHKTCHSWNIETDIGCHERLCQIRNEWPFRHGHTASISSTTASISTILWAWQYMLKLNFLTFLRSKAFDSHTNLSLWYLALLAILSILSSSYQVCGLRGVQGWTPKGAWMY